MDEHYADETTFLTRHSKVRRYGTTLRVSNSSPSQYCIYHVEPSETLQGIALKFNTTVAELKRINKLWSDSIILTTYIKVPSLASTPSSSRESVHNVQSRVTPTPNNQHIQPESVKDILTRIDCVIKYSQQSVSKMERESSVQTITQPPTVENFTTPTFTSSSTHYQSSYQNIGT